MVFNALSTQVFTAFKATCGQNFTAVARAHSFPETMNFFTFANVRFECRSQCIAPPHKEILMWWITFIFTENTFIYLTMTTWKSQLQGARLLPLLYTLFIPPKVMTTVRSLPYHDQAPKRVLKVIPRPRSDHTISAFIVIHTLQCPLSPSLHPV